MDCTTRLSCVLFMVFLLSFSACVSKKRYLEDLSTIETEKNKEIAEQKVQLTSQEASILQLRLQLANKEGANEALLGMQDRYDEKIDSLQYEIEQMNASAENRKLSVGEQLKGKDKIIAGKEAQLQAIKQVLEDRENTLLQLSDAITASLKEVTKDGYMLEVKQGVLRIVLLEKLLFKRGSVTRLNEKGTNALAAISRLLGEYPTLYTQVVGHTDNQAPAIKSYKDNWNFSALRAATVVRTLVNDYDFSPNQIIAAGKGEFEPNASNESAEGREANRRIEMLVGLQQEELVRQIKAKLNTK